MPNNFDTLIATDLTPLDDTQALDLTGQLVDRAGDATDERGLTVAVQWCAAIQARELDPAHRAQLHYFEANAWNGLCIARRKRVGSGQTTEAEEREIVECKEKEIICLRRVKHSDGFEKLHPRRRCQILTNLGNVLDELGRFSEAIECYDVALAIDPDFGMALGNRGQSLAHYVQALPHIPHAPGLCATAAFIHAARDSLRAAIALPLEGDSISCFRKYAEMIERRPAAAEEEVADLNSSRLGDSEVEREYRHWALTHRLFLNPLNDLGPLAAAAVDVLHLPAVTVPIGTGPYYESFFNQMKQEFVSARYLFYEGVTQRQPHFSDAGVTLLDTEDYPVFGLAGEKVKLALRSVYSLFDKIAFFLNYYLRLGIPARRVNFRGVWYQSENASRPLRSEIEVCNSWALRGMQWMSKDLYESMPEFREALEPEAREIDITRNHAEHKYFQVQDDTWPEMGAFRAPSETLPPEASFSIGRRALSARTLRLMKLARSALIYLAYAVHTEERRKQTQCGADDKVFTQPIRLLDDCDKPGVLFDD